MFDLDAECRCRTEQFVERLMPMRHRAHELAHGPCYIIFEAPDEGHQESESRFVQFSFERDSFQIDLPRQTLSRSEAAQIKRERSGFFYLTEGPEYTLHEEEVDGSDPFRSVYLYGQEQSAAEDMAFIFFQVWRLFPRIRFTVSAASFDGRHQWERLVEIN